MAAENITVQPNKKKGKPRFPRKSANVAAQGDIAITFADLELPDTLELRTELPKKTGYIYDIRMELHVNPWSADYIENPQRIIHSNARLEELGLLSKCEIIKADEIPNVELTTQHSEDYIETIRASANMTKEELEPLVSSFDTAYLNQNSWLASQVAADCVVKMTEAVFTRQLRNGLALVRPPGHHALESEACGFSIFNNVALAARHAVDNLGAKRVLIVDWDVHHGQSTQYAFYDDPRVLYFSIHRYEDGSFWPCLRESNHDFVGKDSGVGFNVNVPLNKVGMTNGDYLSIFNTLLLPIAHEFNPELILVSGGFDCILGSSLGEMSVHPSCCAYFVHKLMLLAQGKLVIALEGGYGLESLSESLVHTLRTLLGEPCPPLEPFERPSPSLQETLLNCVTSLRPYWRCLCIQGISEDQLFPDMSKLPDSSWDEKRVAGLPNKVYDPAKPEMIDKLEQLQLSTPLTQYQQRTCVTYTKEMQLHKNEAISSHPEAPQRIEAIFSRLEQHCLIDRCKRIEPRRATHEELELVHTSEYIDTIRSTALSMNQKERESFASNYNSIFLNEHSYNCALLATGSLLSVVDQVCSNECMNGVAIIRPPGHHAEEGKCMGFCLFANVAIAARYARLKHRVNRVLIVDWDVHHGNGTQKIFESDPNVLYISLHRYDNGFFFPCGDTGSPKFVGLGQGAGYSINIGWNKLPIGDAEYLSAFHNVILPVSHEFRPDLVLVSCGFDSAKGDPLGGQSVSPECFGQMTQMLSCLAQGHVILALEGGYRLSGIATCMSHCVASLLGEPCSRPLRVKPPNNHGVESIRATINAQREFWPSLMPTTNLPMYVRRLTRSTQASIDDLVDAFDKSVKVSSSDIGSTTKPEPDENAVAKMD